MKKLLLIALCYSYVFSLETSERLFECTEIFKERKSELLVELERIDEQKQALNALKIATEELLKKKELKLSQKEEIVDKKLREISQKEKTIKEMLVKNETVLEETKELKMNKIAQTFAKMKPASAANILTGMEATEAVAILQSLKPKTVGKILTKMGTKKASELTLLLTK